MRRRWCSSVDSGTLQGEISTACMSSTAEPAINLLSHIAHDLTLLSARQHAPGTGRPPGDRDAAAWWMDAACSTPETRSEASPFSRLPTPYLQPGNLSTRRRGSTFNMIREWQVAFFGVAEGAVRRYCPPCSLNQFAVTSFLNDSGGILYCNDCRMQFGAIPYLPPHYTHCPKREGAEFYRDTENSGFCLTATAD